MEATVDMDMAVMVVTAIMVDIGVIMEGTVGMAKVMVITDGMDITMVGIEVGTEAGEVMVGVV